MTFKLTHLVMVVAFVALLISGGALGCWKGWFGNNRSLAHDQVELSRDPPTLKRVTKERPTTWIGPNSGYDSFDSNKKRHSFSSKDNRYVPFNRRIKQFYRCTTLLSKLTRILAEMTTNP